MNLINCAEKGIFPPAMMRAGIRHLCKQRLETERKLFDQHGPAFRLNRFESLRNSPIAIHTKEANEQHYELPTDFFKYVLGDHLKYSACWWTPSTLSLREAENHMLELYAERADVHDKQTILDLGCGWGSWSLWIAAHYPQCQITSVSNSQSQRHYIEEQAQLSGLTNLKVITQDINTLELSETFDRIISVEMFEHVRNYDLLFSKIKKWLNDDGYLFVHIFCHHDLVYPFELDGQADWMARYFFTGGLMPSLDVFEHTQSHLTIDKEWQVNGTHYEKTANAWLDNLEQNKSEIMPILRDTYGSEATRWYHRWRLFFMACAELFGYKEGKEWQVGHYRFKK